MEMTTVKTVAVFVVILGCFAVLYPKIFHPLILNMLGVSPTKQRGDDMLNRLPPHLRKPNMGQARPVHSSGPSDDIAKHMRGGPHPGMRAAAEMQKQASQGGGGGKGMMGVVLPMYAIGIVVYLIYTLSKIFGNKKTDPDTKTKEERMRQINKGLSEVRYDADRKKFMYGEEDSEGENDDFHNFRQNRRQQRDLEKLLYKADKEKISDLEMRELKRRLLETEAQMTRILSAMETVTDKVQGQRDLRDDEYEEDEYEKENLYPTKKSRVKRQPMQQNSMENNFRQRKVKSNVKSTFPREEEIERKPRRRIVKNNKPEKVKNQEFIDENEYSEVQDTMKHKGREKEKYQEAEYSDDFEDQEEEYAGDEGFRVVEDIGPEQNYQNPEEEFVENYHQDDDESIPEEINADDSEGCSEDYNDSDIDRGMQESQFTQMPNAIRRNQHDDDYEYQNEADDFFEQEDVSSEGEGYVIEDEQDDDDSENEQDKHLDLRKRVVKKGNESQD